MTKGLRFIRTTLVPEISPPEEIWQAAGLEVGTVIGLTATLWSFQENLQRAGLRDKNAAQSL